MHASHKEHIPRINRIEGQIRGIKKMVEEEQYCVDILTQVKAARSALKSLELKLLEGHVQHCLGQALKSGEQEILNEKLTEIMDVLKKTSKG